MSESKKPDGYDDPKAVREKIKQLAQDRQGQKELAAQGLLTPMVPIPGDETTFAEAATAEAMLEAMEENVAQIDASRATKLNEQYVCYVKCRNSANHPRGRPSHGLYLKEYPLTPSVPYKGWRSTIKPNFDDPYFPLEIVCQVCAHDLNQ